MPSPRILALTGASGVGKTTLLRVLAQHGLPDLACYHFDTIGVPSPEEMTAKFGSPDGWQVRMTHAWIDRLAESPADGRVALLEGQMRPSIIRDAFVRAGIQAGRIVLLDCDPVVREQRLRGQRDQPELASPRMEMWAAYLRGQADALDLPILDTTSASPEILCDRLLRHVHALRAL
jgi:GTPase SAR1 family protein